MPSDAARRTKPDAMQDDSASTAVQAQDLQPGNLIPLGDKLLEVAAVPNSDSGRFEIQIVGRDPIGAKPTQSITILCSHSSD
jgi:hypothetical protein